MADEQLQEIIPILEDLLKRLQSAGKDDASKLVCMLTFMAFVDKSKFRSYERSIWKWMVDNVDVQVIDQWPDLLD